MADNVNLTAGDGTIVAGTDNIGGISYPRAKAVWGPDGTVNDTDVASGKPLPVQLRAATGQTLSDTTGVLISTSQLAALATTAQAMSAGFQLTDLPTDGTYATRTGSVTETAPATDIASSGLNGRLQRIAQRISSLIALLPTALGSNGGLKIEGVASGTTVPVTATMAASQLITPVDQYAQYETVAASQTAQAMGATGATGDYLSGVLVFPGTAGCGVVTILDNATTIGTFAGGGTTALPSLVPFMIPVGLFSVSGAWKITTGANVTAVGIGKFT